MNANQAEQEKRAAGTDNLPVSQHQAADLNKLLDSSCHKYADFGAVGMALEEPLTYRQLHERVLVLAAYLRTCGVKFGDRVAILAENSHNWGTIYLAVVRLGAVCVPILPDLPEADVHHILGEMECDILFLTQRQIEKIYDLDRKVDRVVTLDDYREHSGITAVTPFSEFLAEARKRHGAAFADGTLEFSDVGGDQLASILYTSGTSGFSKAVMLTHGNLCANAFAASNVIVLSPGAVFLSVLPVSHTYEFTVGFVMPLIKGGCVLYAGNTHPHGPAEALCAGTSPCHAGGSADHGKNL